MEQLWYFAPHFQGMEKSSSDILPKISIFNYTEEEKYSLEQHDGEYIFIYFLDSSKLQSINH